MNQATGQLICKYVWRMTSCDLGQEGTEQCVVGNRDAEASYRLPHSGTSALPLAHPESFLCLRSLLSYSFGVPHC